MLFCRIEIWNAAFSLKDQRARAGSTFGYYCQMQGRIPRFAPPLASFFGLMSCTLICGLLALAALPDVGFVLIGWSPGLSDSVGRFLLDAWKDASFCPALRVFLRLDVLHFDLRLTGLGCFA
jgi:hypothetical protein